MQERQAQLDRLRKELHEVNWQRKSAQTAAADKLTLLHQNWLSLVSKNFQLEGVCALTWSSRSADWKRASLPPLLLQVMREATTRTTPTRATKRTQWRRESLVRG